jgi:hypothetical protein
MPERIQLRRTKGWRKPDGAVVVSRPTKWGNPFTIAAAIEAGWADDEEEAREVAVECFEDVIQYGRASVWWFSNGAEQIDWIRRNVHTLQGSDLACWCRPDQACHGDVLIKYANGGAA